MLKTRYMGLELKSPVIAGSCGLTTKVDLMKAAEQAGAGAIVMKSLFEEQIGMEAESLIEQSGDYAESHDYIHHYVRQNNLHEYCKKIKELKAALSIPVFASINCFSDGEWTAYASEIEAAGADGLEVNLYSIPLSLQRTSAEIEKEYENIVRALVKAVKIPVAVKISSQVTSVPHLADRLKAVGAKAVVMFNRFFQPDIDIEKLDFVAAERLSDPKDHVQILRNIAITSSLVKDLDLSASTGIHDGVSAIKSILAGAATVQIASELYRSGVIAIENTVKGIEEYMQRKGFSSVDSMKGKLTYARLEQPAQFERTQFLRVFGKTN